MSQVLRSKNLATKFQILVEIAAAQPNIQQKDIARKLDITPQAVSEYIKELTKEGSLTSDARSHYRVTREGVDWVLRMARELQDYCTSVGKAITSITVCTAVADCDLSCGQTVGLRMEGGLLLASDAVGGAQGVAVTDAKKGEEIGISDIEGIVEFELGEITICQVPGIQDGGSKKVDLSRLRKEVKGHKIVGAIGIEALMALRRAAIEPQYLYGVKEAVIEAAHSGLSSLVVCIDDEIPGLLQRLAEENVGYKLLDLRSNRESA